MEFNRSIYKIQYLTSLKIIFTGWSCGSSGRALAKNAQVFEFKLQYHQKKVFLIMFPAYLFITKYSHFLGFGKYSVHPQLELLHRRKIIKLKL
jgi:hypothetical protein